jgi:hypothetical protein
VAASAAAPAAPMRNGVGNTGSAPPVISTSRARSSGQPAIGLSTFTRIKGGQVMLGMHSRLSIAGSLRGSTRPTSRTQGRCLRRSMRSRLYFWPSQPGRQRSSDVAHHRRCARLAEGPLWGELPSGNIPRRASGIGAWSTFARVASMDRIQTHTRPSSGCNGRSDKG